MSVHMIIALVIVLLAVGLFIFRAIPGLRAYFNFRGKRLVTCPENEAHAAVEVNAIEAAEGAFLGEPTLRLHECSRWPEREGCGQECLKQIEADPETCLVWNIVSKWYEGKKCVFCQKTIGPLHHADHAPALLGPDYKTTEWNQLKAEDLPNIFARYQPVCWNCHVAETFRRMHPELVTDRKPESNRIA